MASPIGIAFDLPFEEAIEWARKRVAVLPDTYYDDLPARVRGRAFTVSGLASLDQIQGVLDSLTKGIEQGGTFAEWQKWALEQPGIGQMPRHRLETIYRTAIQTHYNAGRTQQQRANKARRPFYLWDAINDSRTRPDHAAMDGYIAPIDDPIWQKWSPPASWNCRCSRLALSAKQAAARGYPMPAPQVDAPDFDYEALDGQDAKLDQIMAERLGKVDPVVAEKMREVIEAAQISQAGLPKTVFEPQPTAKKAAEWAVKNNLVDFADYGKLSPAVANQMNKGLLDTLAEFPELRKNQEFIGSCQSHFNEWYKQEVERKTQRLMAKGAERGNAENIAKYLTKKPKNPGNKFAHSWDPEGLTGIAFNEKFGSRSGLASLQETLDYNVMKGFHPIGTNTVKATVDHEFGHQLDLLLDLSKDAEVVALHRGMVSAGTVGTEVSGYAKKNIEEFIAEAWAEYRNNENPRPTAESIGRIVQARYRSKYAARN